MDAIGLTLVGLVESCFDGDVDSVDLVDPVALLREARGGASKLDAAPPGENALCEWADEVPVSADDVDVSTAVGLLSMATLGSWPVWWAVV